MQMLIYLIMISFQIARCDLTGHIKRNPVLHPQHHISHWPVYIMDHIADSGEVIRRVQGETDGQFSVWLPAGCYHAVLLVYTGEKTKIEPYYYDNLGRWVIDAEQADKLVLDDGQFMVLNSPN